jgi:hypothetical protein
MADTVIVKEVKALITATDESSPGIQQFEKRLDAMKDHARGVGHDAGEGLLEGLSEKFGRSSFSAHILHALEGAGPLLAVGLGAHLFADLGESIKSTTEQIAEGKSKADELSESFIKSVPIVGNIYKGVYDIAESMSGITAQATIFKAEAEAAEKSFEGIKEIIGIAHRNRTAVGEDDGVDEFDKGRRRAEKRSEEAKEEIQKKFDSELVKQKAELAQAQQALENVKAKEEGAFANVKTDPILHAQAESRIQSAKGNIAALEHGKNSALSQIEEDKQKELQRNDREESERAAKESDRLLKEQGEEKKQQADFALRMNELQHRLGTNLTEGLKKQGEEKRREADHQLDVGAQLEKMTIDNLMHEGGISKIQEKKLAVAEQYNQKRKELLKIINDENATEDQKAQAKDLLSGLAGGEQRAIREAIRTPRTGTATATSAGGLTGLVEAATTHASDPMSVMAANSKISTEQTKKATDILDKMLGLLQQNPSLGTLVKM